MAQIDFYPFVDELDLDPLSSYTLEAVFDKNTGMTKACLQSSETMCVDAVHTCE